MLLVFYSILKVKMMRIFSLSRHIQGMLKELTPCFLACAVRHVFDAIICSLYRSHSPIARDTCHLEAGEARKFIIGKGLKLSMLLNSDLVLCVEPDRCISQLIKSANTSLL